MYVSRKKIGIAVSVWWDYLCLYFIFYFQEFPWHMCHIFLSEGNRLFRKGAKCLLKASQ